jgi:hypothetical protein
LFFAAAILFQSCRLCKTLKGVGVVKRCHFCGRYFVPDGRVKEKQKACFDPRCKKKRKKAAQDAWSRNNPGYFTGRYPYVRSWRAKKIMIQDGIPSTKPLQKLVFLVPANSVQMIQDKILLKRSGKRTFVADGYG